MLALSGAWNSHLDMQPCDEEGDPLPGSKTTRLWQVHSWPAFLSICMLINSIWSTYSSQIHSAPLDEHMN